MSEEATTPDLVELGRRLFDAANRRDFDAMMSFWAPDAVWRYEGGYTFEGRAAIRGFLEDMASSFDDLHAEFEEIIDLGNGVVFSVIILTGRPVGSSGEVRLRYADVGIWTESVIEQVTGYWDLHEARAAAERLAEERG
jgi:ketosteroid isomerase-like protein